MISAIALRAIARWAKGCPGRTGFRCGEKVLGRRKPYVGISSLLAPLDLLVAAKRMTSNQLHREGVSSNSSQTSPSAHRATNDRVNSQEEVKTPTARVTGDVRT